MKLDMDKSFEGQGIYAGNWTFVLSILGSVVLGGFGTLIACSGVDVSEQGFHVMLHAADYGIGGALAGIAAGAAVGLLVGSTAARSFHIPFLASLFWLLTRIPVLLIGNVVAARGAYASYYLTYHSYVGLASILLGALLGAWIGRRTFGFAHSARRRARLGVLITFPLAFIATIAFFQSQPGVGSILQLPAHRLIGFLTVAGLFAIAASLVGSIIGALLGADRDRLRGFALDTPSITVTVAVPAQILQPPASP